MTGAGMGYGFTDAEHALTWSVEVLRRRRLPKQGLWWREVESEAEFVARAWEGEKPLGLPTDAEGRFVLAMKVEQALSEVAKVDGQGAWLLRAWAMGDWVDEATLQGALAVQEKLRRQGLRVRIAYRYSYAQLGLLLGVSAKEAWRRVRAALELLGRELERGRGLKLLWSRWTHGREHEFRCNP